MALVLNQERARDLLRVGRATEEHTRPGHAERGEMRSRRKDARPGVRKSHGQAQLLGSLAGPLRMELSPDVK